MVGKNVGRCSRSIRPFGTLVACLLLLVSIVEAQQPRKATRQPVKQADAAKPATKPKVVAVVNRQTITREQLGKECIRRFGKKVLESEVNKHLILQACHAKGIKITNGDINDEIQRMAQKFSLPVDRWLEMLRQERDITVNEYKRDIVWPTLALRKLAAGKTEVTDTEIKKAYTSQYGPAVQVRLIVSRSKTKAQKLHQAATRSPDQFDRLAKDQSEDENSAATRGLIPPIRRYAGDSRVEAAAFALKPGQVSPIVETAGQFLIMKCERHIPAQELSREQKTMAVAQIKDKLTEKKLRNAASGMFAQLQAKATIVNVLNDKETARQHPGVAAIVNGREISLEHLAEQCILRQGEVVLDGEINRAVLSQALKRRSQTVEKKDLQDEIRLAAMTYGSVTSEGTADVDSWLKKVTTEGDVTVDTYVRDAVWPSAALKKLAGGAVKISEEDIKKGFAANYGERVEVLAIVLSSQRTAHEVFDLARKNPSEKFFGELAHQYSSEPVSRSNYGQVPPIRKFGGQPMVEEEAFQLKPGEISGVLAVGDKFIILRCLGRTKPVVENLETVKSELVKDIREKKMRIAMSREFDRLKEKSQIDNFLAKTTSTGDVGGSGVQKVSHQAPTR